MVAIGGYSGIGKSSLVHEVYKPIAETSGHFLFGKFDQFEQQGHNSLEPQAVSEKILSSLSESIDIGDRDVRIGASIGVALFPDHSDDREHLIELADQAKYEVKKKGRDGFHIANQ